MLLREIERERERKVERDGCAVRPEKHNKKFMSLTRNANVEESRNKKCK